MKPEYKILGMAFMVYALIMASTLLFYHETLSIASQTGQHIVNSTAYNTADYIFYVIISIVAINLLIIWLSKAHPKLLGYFMHAYMIFAIVVAVLILSFIYLSPLTKLPVIFMPIFIIGVSVCLIGLYLLKETHNKYFNLFAILASSKRIYSNKKSIVIKKWTTQAKTIKIL